MNGYKALLNRAWHSTVLICLLLVSAVKAQIVTNGSFESSSVGVVDTAGWAIGSYAVKGWVIQVADTVKQRPVFEIVSDTVEQGNRALKVTAHGLGVNQWDIQIVADSLPVIPGVRYNYSVWAKSKIAGETVNFTTWSQAGGEYGAIRPATLTTQWTRYTMQFTVNDASRYIRGPIHFYGTVDTGNAIWIDNLQIVDPNVGKKPVIVEAETGQLGSHFKLLQDGSTNYVTTDTNWTSLTSPGDTSRMITFQVPFADSGTYNLFARVRVGSGTFNDDSFFYGAGFGQKSDTAASDWIFINGLASAGFSDSAAFVDAPGTAGSTVWKWVNLSKNTYSGVKGDSFMVSLDSLNRTFQIGSREDGLDFDKIAFGKSNLYFTVHALDSVLAGAPTMQSADTGTKYTGPALAQGSYKFLGSLYTPNQTTDFLNLWTQMTPENAGKWGSVGVSTDTTQWSWGGLDAQYNYAMTNHLIFKDHCLIWGAQQPTWISGLDSATQAMYIETWIRNIGQRYPNTGIIDVVNEALNGHNPPDGGGSPARANYKNALGGNGTTGWDWVINSFALARKYLPNTKLLINDYGIINDNNATNSYLGIINLLKDRGLIDGIGVQGHRFEFESADTNTLKSNLDKLTATGLPIYITEFDLGNLSNSGTPNDNQQLQLYMKVFPILWRHPGVKGITIWGYKEGLVWQTTTYLVRADGTARPALLWLASYIKNNPLGVTETASKLPSTYELEQNFPNPFNPATSIRYSIPGTSKVTLRVFDVLGREVQTLVNTVQAPGQYTVTFNAEKLATGVYFYQLQAGYFTETKKLLLVK